MFHQVIDWLKSKNGKRDDGQSLIEVLISVAIGVLFIIAAVASISPALKTSTQASRAEAGTALAKELLNNVRVWSDANWSNVAQLATSSANHYYLSTSSSPFSSVAGDEVALVATTTYARYFYVDDVYRDAGDVLVSSGGAYDPSTKKLTVAYSWPQSSTATISMYITRRRDNIFWQTDWSGGSGQNGPITSVNGMFSTSSNIDYTTTTGSIIVKFQ